MWVTRKRTALTQLVWRQTSARSLFALPSKKFDVPFVSAEILPSPQHVPVNPSLDIGYVDVGPSNGKACNADKTIVLLHGAAGTYQDFRYLIPHLQRDFRVVGIDLPGCGTSVAKNSDETFKFVKPLEVASVTLEAMQRICGQDEKIFLLGHSLGAHAVLNVASLNQQLNNTNVNINGLVFIAPAGPRPHRAMPGNGALINMVCNAIQSDMTAISTAARKANSFFYKRVLGFRDAVSDDEFAVATLLAGATDFGHVADAIQRTKTIPSFIAYALDDPLLEKEVPQELGMLCHDGPRISFKEGGHNLQKTKATEIAAHLIKWISTFD